MRSHGFPKAKGKEARRFSDPRIIELRPRLPSRKRRKGPVVDPLCQFEIDDRRRLMQQNMAAVAVLVILVAAGLWLFQQLKESSRVLLCIEAGRNACMPIDQTHRRNKDLP
jgi:hypothetical protein